MSSMNHFSSGISYSYLAICLCLMEPHYFALYKELQLELTVSIFSLKVIDDIDWMRPQDFVRPDDPILISDRNEGFAIK